MKQMNSQVDYIDRAENWPIKNKYWTHIFGQTCEMKWKVKSKLKWRFSVSNASWNFPFIFTTNSLNVVAFGIQFDLQNLIATFSRQYYSQKINGSSAIHFKMRQMTIYCCAYFDRMTFRDDLGRFYLETNKTEDRK